MQLFRFRSVFSKLFASVMLALTLFAMAMVLLTQVVQDNNDNVHIQIMANQVLEQVDPFVQIANHSQSHLKSRIALAMVKKSFDVFDESVDAKMGLYSQDQRLLVQTQNSDLPKHLPSAPSWFERTFPSLAGTRAINQVQVVNDAGFTLLYQPRQAPKVTALSAVLNLFTGTFLLLVIMAGVLWWIAHSITWRLDQMSQQMTHLGDGDFSVRVPVTGNDEIATLAEGFNQTAQKIEKLIDANSLLLAHASHELRTPITRIRLQVEMMDMIANQLPTADKDKFDKRAKAINRDLTGLNDLVESILLVSRLDAGHAVQQVERLDFFDLVLQEVQHYPEAALMGESVVIQCQPKLLTHLVRNLLNNAMIHGTPPIQLYLYGLISENEADVIPERILADISDVNGMTNEAVMTDKEDKQNIPNEVIAGNEKVNGDRLEKRSEKVDQLLHKTSDTLLKIRSKMSRLDTAENYHYVALAVVDQGSGIPMEKREDIFSPFVRLNQHKKGSGLGLSLVAQIVTSHQGHIRTDTWQGKTRFLVLLPVQVKVSA